MGDDALLRLGLADQHDAVGERQRRRAVEERRRHDMRARVEQSARARASEEAALSDSVMILS